MENEEEERKLKAFIYTLISSLLHFVPIINWVYVSEIRVVIFLYSPLLISEFLLLSSLCHIDQTTSLFVQKAIEFT